jgi:hypothetical protein
MYPVDIYIHNSIYTRSCPCVQLRTTPWRRMGEWVYRSTHSWAGWTPEPVSTWRREKSRPYRDSNSDPSAVQPVANHYTDCAIRALIGAHFLEMLIYYLLYWKRWSSFNNIHRLNTNKNPIFTTCSYCNIKSLVHIHVTNCPRHRYGYKYSSHL